MSVTAIAAATGDPGEPVHNLVNTMRWDAHRELSEHDHRVVDEFVARLAGMSDVEVAVNWGYDSPAAIKDLRTTFNGSWR